MAGSVLEQLLEEPEPLGRERAATNCYVAISHSGPASARQDEFQPPILPHIALSGVSATFESNSPDTTYQQSLPTREQPSLMSDGERTLFAFFLFMEAYHRDPEAVLTFLTDRK